MNNSFKKTSRVFFLINQNQGCISQLFIKHKAFAISLITFNLDFHYFIQTYCLRKDLVNLHFFNVINSFRINNLNEFVSLKYYFS